MKRGISISLLVLLMMSLLILTSCGNDEKDYSDSRYVGKWKGVNMSVQDLGSEPVEDEWILTLNADGTGTMDNGEEVNELTWTLLDNGFKTKGGLKATFKDDGDNITTRVLGVDLTFEKQ